MKKVIVWGTCWFNEPIDILINFYKTSIESLKKLNFDVIPIIFDAKYDNNEEDLKYLYGQTKQKYPRDLDYFKDCYIEGDVDFVFGGARAVFDHCTLFGRNPEPGNPDKIGYVCAPCTVAAQKYGLFFINCSVDGDFEKDRLYLGRPWHPAMNPYHNCCAVFMHCQMSDVVREAGWKHMGGYQVRNNRLYEFENTGAGAFVNDNRRQLDPETAKDWTILKVLGWENLGWMETSAEK